MPLRTKPPVVSVIMANYNGAAHIEAAISSVQAQSIRNIEILVSDDASIDQSVTTVQSIIATDARVRLINSTINRGPGAARNRALNIATGDWIAVFDADDLIHPRRFERMIELADQLQTDAIADEMLIFSENRIGEARAMFGGLNERRPYNITIQSLIASDINPATQVPFGYLKPMFRKEALNNLRYREDIQIGEDYDFYTRFLLNGGRLHLLGQSYYLYRRHQNSFSYRLSADDMSGMIKAQQSVEAEFPAMSPEIKQHFRARSAVLAYNREFENLVSSIKSRRITNSVRILAQKPSLCRPLLRSAAENFVNRFQRTGSSRPNSSDLNLGSAANGSDGYLEKAARQPIRLPKTEKTNSPNPLVHIRTPTYRRPVELKRCLESLQAQTHTNWICDVFDDDPNCSAQEIVENFADHRIRHNWNRQQKFASENIDQCFSRRNPHGADYFCVVEDDNLILPTFIAENTNVCLSENVEIVFRNQFVEFGSGTDNAKLSDGGILDRKLVEGRYEPDLFRLALVADIGVSNGGLFWSRHAISDLEIHFDCSATLQEYLRTYAIDDPIFVAMEPLAVWAENGEATNRDLGVKAGYLRSELNLKRSIRILQRKAWSSANPDDTNNFLSSPIFAFSKAVRARGLLKSHLKLSVGQALPFSEKLWLIYRGCLIRLLGRPEPGLLSFLTKRRV